MKKQVLIIGVLACASVTMTFAQRSLVGSQKQRVTHPAAPQVRGGAPTGETCADAITAVVGINASDGPATGGGCFNCTDAANADWFIYTPSGAGTVTLSTCLGGVDTRVWVYETTVGCAELELVAANDDFCELTPGGDEYASQVEFVVCAGKTYYFEWDDRWETTAFNFTLTFTPIVGAELAMTYGSVTEYTHLPQSAGVITVAAGYRNNGSVPLTNVNGTLTITKNGSPFSTNASIVAANMLTCTGDDYVAPAVLAQEPGDYEGTFVLQPAETEANTGNNSVTETFTIDSTFARDNGEALGTFGIGTTGVLGQSFFLPKPDKLTSVSIKLADAVIPGSTMQIRVFATDNSGMPTGSVLASSAVLNVTDADTAGWMTIPLTGGPLNLPAGGFFIGFAESADDVQLPVGITDNRYTSQVWANVPGITTGFEELSTLGFGGFVFLLRANFGQTYNWSSVEEATALSDVTLMPNPTSGMVTIRFGEAASDARISVLDATGKIVKEEMLYNTASVNHTLDLSTFAQGVYTVRIVAGNDVTARKLILTR